LQVRVRSYMNAANEAEIRRIQRALDGQSAEADLCFCQPRPRSPGSGTREQNDPNNINAGQVTRNEMVNMPIRSVDYNTRRASAAR